MQQYTHKLAEVVTNIRMQNQFVQLIGPILHGKSLNLVVKQEGINLTHNTAVVE